MSTTEAVKAGMQGTERGRFVAFLDALAESRGRALAFFAFIALVTRCSIAWDWNYEIDVQFYMLAGRRLLDGALLYVDVWDRKPPALYLAYAALVALPNPIVAVQVAGGACTALAAYGIHRIALSYTGAQGSLLAGLAYCVLTMDFGGATGQAAVLFAPLMVAAVWSIAVSLPELGKGHVPGRIIVGIGCAGLAVAFKQSALIEASVFGAIVVVLAWIGGARIPQIAGMTALLMLVGAMPLLASCAWYLAIGHFHELWQALVLSNVKRLYPNTLGMLTRYWTLLRVLAPIGLFAVMGARAMWPLRTMSGAFRLALVWLGAATIALMAYPGLYLHYALPLLAPLCLVAAPFFARRDIGIPACAVFSIATLVHADAFDFVLRERSRESSAEITRYLTAEAPHHRLLLWNNSPWLYELLRSTPPSPLMFPPHLYDGAEAGASGLDTTVEVRRILAWRPEAIVMQDLSRVSPLNDTTVALVDSYIKQCRRVRPFTLFDHNGPQPQVVYSGCAEAGSTGG